jgi:hypothetical protein
MVTMFHGSMVPFSQVLPSTRNKIAAKFYAPDADPPHPLPSLMGPIKKRKVVEAPAEPRGKEHTGGRHRNTQEHTGTHRRKTQEEDTGRHRRKTQEDTGTHKGLTMAEGYRCGIGMVSMWHRDGLSICRWAVNMSMGCQYVDGLSIC